MEELGGGFVERECVYVVEMNGDGGRVGFGIGARGGGFGPRECGWVGEVMVTENEGLGVKCFSVSGIDTDE